MIKSIRKKLDKHLIKVLTVSFAVIFVVSGTLAYMTAKDDVTNTFSGESQGGEVKIAEDFPDNEIFFDPEKEGALDDSGQQIGSEKKEKEIWVYNTTNSDVFVRVNLTAWAQYDISTDSSDSVDSTDSRVPTKFDYSQANAKENPYIEVGFQWVNSANYTKFRIYLDDSSQWYCDTANGYFYYKDDLEGSETEKIYSNRSYRYNGSYEIMNSEEECTVPLVKSVQLSEFDSLHNKLVGFSLTAEMDYVSVTEDSDGKEQMQSIPEGWLTPDITYAGNEIESIKWGNEE